MTNEERACHRTGCENPVGPEVITLLNPHGQRGRTCGPYCEDHTGELRRLLIANYPDGGSCYVVEAIATTSSSEVTE